MKKPKLALVLPCYNEEEVINITSKKIIEVLNDLIRKRKVDESSFVCFVDDGSIDNTWILIKALHQRNQEIKGIKLARNFGHQKALLAGLLGVKENSDCIITLDADLQDDVNKIEEMVNKYHEGYDIVYGVRNKRNVDSLFKRITAKLYYKFLQLLKVETINNHSDFRLVTNKVVNELSKFREKNLYLRGIIPLIGYKSSVVYYERKKRTAGETKYSIIKMLSFAWDGITSFSVFPMRLILVFGLIVLTISFVLFLWAFILALMDKSIPGWASTVIPMYVLGGLQMAGIGLLGEYIGKTYSEVKSRPRFVIEEEIF